MSYIVITDDFNGKGLKLIDKIILALIYGYCQEGQGIFIGTTTYMSEYLECTRPTVSEALKRLCGRGLLEKGQIVENGTVKITYKIGEGCKEILQGCKEILQGSETSSSLPSSSPPHPPINNQLSSTSVQNYERGGGTTEKGPRFTPPKLEEVKELVRDKGYGVDPLKFWTYYEAQGWKLSNGVPMKNWKAALVRWALKDLDRHGDR